MGIEQITLKTGVTAVTLTGGTDLQFAPDGVEIKSGLHVAAPSISDFRVRPSITFRTRNPTLVNGVYSKGKRWVTFTQPKVLASGSVVHNIIRTEAEIHPETTVAEQDDMFFIGSQLFTAADILSFLATGSLK